MRPEQKIIELMFRIPDKEGKDVDFILNREQAEFVENMTGRDIIAKARQLGFSTLVLGIFLARCLMARNRKCVIVSHDVMATQKLLDRIKYMMKHMKGAQPDLKYNTQNFIHFAKTDSSIYIGTAGSANFGVGDTITDLHCSEVSLWENPGPLLSGLFQAVPTSGNIVIESTGHGTGNWFHRSCMRAADGNSGYQLHFVSWLQREEYQIELKSGETFIIDPMLEEEQCIETHGLTVPQLLWRRMKISELDGDLQAFREQYPCSLAECFQATGSSFFSKINYVLRKDWQREDSHTWRLGNHPQPGRTYAAGADIAAGVGLDSSVLEIFDIQTGEQVLEFSTNRQEPDLFAQRCAEYLEEFNDAFFNFERNGQGILFASEIIKHYRKDRIHQTVPPRQKGRTVEKMPETRKLAAYGTFSSEVTKPLMCGRMKAAMRNREVVIHSAILNSECSSFVEDGNGRLAAETGCHDDHVIATAFAISMMPKAAAVSQRNFSIQEAIRGKRTNELFALDQVLLELEKRYESSENDGYPIGSGVDLESSYD